MASLQTPLILRLEELLDPRQSRNKLFSDGKGLKRSRALLSRKNKRCPGGKIKSFVFPPILFCILILPPLYFLEIPIFFYVQFCRTSSILDETKFVEKLKS